MLSRLKRIFAKYLSWKKGYLLPVAVLVLGGFIFGNTAHAVNLLAWVGEGLVWLVYLIIGFIIQLVSVLIGQLLTQIVGILMKVIEYNGFIHHNVVVTGWALARDISNMFFVIILLVIAIGTILRAENYNYKRMLPRLLIVVILINFSKLIAGFIIDFAQVFMLTFAAAVKPTLEGNIFSKFGIDSLYSLKTIFGAPGSFGAGSSALDDQGGYDILYLTLSLLLAFIMMVIAFFVVLVYLVIFLFRIIMLWVLIVLSPFAFLLSTFPRGQAYYKEWWDKFISYVIAGPILIFFFWLAMQTNDSALKLDISQRLGFEEAARIDELGIDAEQIGVAIGYTEAGSAENVLRFIVTTCLLIGGLVAAQRVQVAGSQFATSTLSGLRRQWGGLRPIYRPVRSLGGYMVGEVRARLGLPSKKEWKEGWEFKKLKTEEERTKAKLKKSEDLYKGEIKWYNPLSWSRTLSGLRAVGASPGHAFHHFARLKNILPWEFVKEFQKVRRVGWLDTKKQIEDLQKKEQEAQEALETGYDAYARGKKVLEGRALESAEKSTFGQVKGEMEKGDYSHAVYYGRGAENKEEKISFKKFEEKEKVENAMEADKYLDASHAIDYKEIEKDTGSGTDKEKEMRKKAESLAKWRKQVDEQQKERMRRSGAEYGLDVSKYIKDGKIQEEEIQKIADPVERENVEKTVDYIHRELKERTAHAVVDDEVITNKRADVFRGKTDEEIARVGIQDILRQANEEQIESARLLGEHGGRHFLDKEAEAKRRVEINDKKKEEQKARDQLRILANKKSEAIRTGDKAAEAKLEEQEKKLNEYINLLGKKLKELTAKADIRVELRDKNGNKYTEVIPVYKNTAEEEEKMKEKEIQEKRKKVQEKAAERAKRLYAVAESPTGMTADERDRWQRQLEEARRERGRLELLAEQQRPYIDYQARKEQRIAIAKEKADMTTDSWQELLTFYQDAVKSGDSIRAAAAMQKATEYANENEFMNSLGYDSGPSGLKDMVENEWIGKLGMGRELAMTIANDISYAAERNFHWGLGRVIGTDRAGTQFWQSEQQRELETLAEVRKLDFESFMRRANRLAYGKEVIPGATREERMQNFVATGDRDFYMDNFGKTFIMENAENFESLIRRGRFNINLGVNISQPQNLDALEKIFFLAKHPGHYQQMIHKIRDEFGAKPGEGPFDNLMTIHGMFSK